VRTDEAAPSGQERFAHIAPNTISHPALRLLSDPAASDLGAARVKRHWVLVVEEAQSAREGEVSVACAFDNGEPCLLQRKLARGFTMTLALSLDRDFSDLPLQECYVPLVHELLYYLAAPSRLPMNVLPGERIDYPIPGRIRPGDVVEMVPPDGRRTPIKLQPLEKDRWLASYAQTASPGLYRLSLPDEALGELATRPGVTSTAASASAPLRGVPFIVLSDPDESRLELLSDDDYRRAGQHVHLVRAGTLGEVIAAIAGGVPGSEIWQQVAIVLLLVLIAETVMTRLIAMRRKAHLTVPVAFGTDQVDAEQFRARAREMLASPPSPKREVQSR
jgi:hypothetical protein